jgi:small-conductance mechanosensitive channel
MTEGKRPGGLTALAVINLILFVTSLLSLATFAIIGKVPTEDMDERQRIQIEAFQNMDTSVLVVLFAFTLLTGVLLVLSGVGYLKQKRFLGRTLGSTYAVVAIASSLISAVMMPPELEGGVNLGTLIGLIYPIVTLILINTTFRDDLTN